MSNFPNSIDDDSTLPAVNDNIDQIGGDAINALRDAVFSIEQNLGIGIAGSTPSLAARLGVFINPDGSPNTSIIYSLGLVTLPVTNSQIAEAAGIPESKLMLDYRTQDLFNYIRDLSKDVNLAIGWISVSGVKLEPHLIGAIYRHDLAQIDVAETSAQFLNNVFRVLRDNTDAYTVINDMNNELLAHQWADGSAFGVIKDIVTNNGSIYTSNYAHTASGIFLNTTRFAVIPQTADNVQLFAEFIDQSSILTLGTRIQNLYASGISRNSRSSSLTTDGYGQQIIGVTPAIAYLRGEYGTQSSPWDTIDFGDDIIQFFPTSDSTFSFDEQFALVRPGDIVRVNYGVDGYNIEVPYVISEKKYMQGGGNSVFAVRIAGKNIAYSPQATARIDRPLFNNNKYGVLAVAPGVGTSSGSSILGSVTPSLIVGTPRGAQCLGVGFSPDQFNETHYNLWLCLYPTGNPLDGYVFLPPVDVTGNQGITPGAYTLSRIVEATNNAFRQPGFNYRFIAFHYEGEFGIMLADSYNNASFSVVSAVVGPGGTYDQASTYLNFSNNVVDVFPTSTTVTAGGSQTLPGTLNVVSTEGFDGAGSITVVTTLGPVLVGYTSTTPTSFLGVGGTGTVSLGSQVTQPLIGVNAPDPLGFGPAGAGIATPPFQGAYGSAEAASFPTIIFPPLRRNNYYVNGAELEKMPLDVSQALDPNGDGYWVATVDGYNTNPGPPGHMLVTYQIPLDLSASGLKAGKTIVVQPVPGGSNYGLINYGRFVIQNVTFTCCPPVQTQITVYDAVHAQGSSPYPVLNAGSEVAIYFSSDSVSFNDESATDNSSVSGSFKRNFEVYIDDTGATFTHERARLSLSGPVNVNGVTLYNNNTNLNQLDLVTVSAKLRGYQFGSVTKINIYFTSFDPVGGTFTANLGSFDGVSFTRPGPTVTGKIGEVTRLYDETNVDFIEINFVLNNTVPVLGSGNYIDLQLFPSLQLDQELMLLATCQERTDTNVVNYLTDRREFGNTSEEELTTSALTYLSTGDRELHFNGVIRGFDAIVNGAYGADGLLSINGGLALVNGNFEALNDQIFTIPPLQEYYVSQYYPINYALCVNSNGQSESGDLVTVVLTDSDPDLGSFGTPTVSARVVTVQNQVTGNYYKLDSCTFSYLLNNRKDLTPLYIVSAVVTGTGSAATTVLTLRDVRRFVNESDSNIPAVLTSDSAQGNFKTIDSALDWLKFNSTFQNTLQVKGTFSLNTDPGLNFPLFIEGGGNPAILNFTNAIPGTLSISDVTFSNMNVVFNCPLTATNVTFDNCTITFTRAVTLNNVIIDPSTVYILTGGLLTVNNTSILNSTVNVNVTKGFSIGSGNSFTGSTFNYNVVPSTGYSTSDLVNAGSGMMYANISSTATISGLRVQNCIFNSLVSDHFPFISLQLSAYGAVFQDISITDNQFNAIPNSLDERRAVIAITSTLGGTAYPASVTYPTFPRLVNADISNNICNFDQMILVSTNRSTSGGTAGAVIGAMIACSNCRISRNLCGLIGYMTAADFVSNNFNNDPANLGANRDKPDQLTISNNNCHMITNLDSTGKYIAFAATEVSTGVDSVQVSTGAVNLTDNIVNWMSVGVASYTSTGTYISANADGLIVTNNRFTPGNSAFIGSYYQDSGNSNLNPPKEGLLIRASTSASGDFSNPQSIVANNIFDNKVLITPTGTYEAYGYDITLRCEASAIIRGNILNQTNPFGGPMVKLGGTSAGGPSITFTNNTLNRGSATITAYVQAQNSNATNNVIITGNIFDSPTIDGTSTATGLNIPSTWSFYGNVNQTGYAVLPLASMEMYIDSSTGGTPVNVLSNTTSASIYSNGPAISAGIYRDQNMQINKDYKNGTLAGQYYIVMFDTSSPTQANASRTVTFLTMLDSALPNNVKIVSANIGLIESNALGGSLDTSSDNNNQFTLSVYNHNNTLTSNSAQGILDVNYNVGGLFNLDKAVNLMEQFTLIISGSASSGTGYNKITQSQFNAATNYVPVTIPTPGNFVTGSLSPVGVEFTVNYKTTGTGSPFLLFSPIVVTYRW